MFMFMATNLHARTTTRIDIHIRMIKSLDEISSFCFDHVVAFESLEICWRFALRASQYAGGVWRFAGDLLVQNTLLR